MTHVQKKKTRLHKIFTSYFSICKNKTTSKQNNHNIVYVQSEISSHHKFIYNNVQIYLACVVCYVLCSKLESNSKFLEIPRYILCFLVKIDFYKIFIIKY